MLKSLPTYVLFLARLSHSRKPMGISGHTSRPHPKGKKRSSCCINKTHNYDL